MNSEIQFLLYSLPDEEGKVQVIVKDETIWCTQKAMAQLFGVGVPAISKHLKNIFQEGELQKEVVVSKMEITTRHGAMEGKTQTFSVDFYHLDAIIAVGYRGNSLRATKFRQWATKILNEYIRKGFVLDDERLKQGTAVHIRQRLHEYFSPALPFSEVQQAVPDSVLKFPVLRPRFRSTPVLSHCIWQDLSWHAVHIYPSWKVSSYHLFLIPSILLGFLLL